MITDVEQAVVRRIADVALRAGVGDLANGVAAGVGFHDGWLRAGVVGGRVVGEACVGGRG